MPTASDGIEDLLRHPAVWRVGDASAPQAQALSSGFPALDARLPGGGWPRGAVTEILAAGEGIGELELLAPALAGIAAQGGWIVCIAPPHVPYAPAFAIHGVDVSRLLVVRGDRDREDLWAAEQALKSAACGAVLLWESAGSFSVKCLRRLQLAAEAGGGFGVLFRDRRSGAAPSPAALKLHLAPDPAGLAVTVLKSRGGIPGARVVISGASRVSRHP
jgi:hypothetical protein